MKSGNLLAVGLVACLLTACGDSGSSESMGVINISLTDAPIDDVSEVNVQLSGVFLKPAGGNEMGDDQIVFTDPRTFTIEDGMTKTINF